jgi:hypothetical protein
VRKNNQDLFPKEKIHSNKRRGVSVTLPPKEDTHPTHH